MVWVDVAEGEGWVLVDLHIYTGRMPVIKVRCGICNDVVPGTEEASHEGIVIHKACYVCSSCGG